jgi:TM2 domain-containing membrane protein YozV
MFCSSCGTQNPDSAKFCEKCGTGLTAAPPPPPPEDVRARGPIASTHPGHPTTGKNPWVALVLSFVIPGVGQFYNSDNKKGAIMLIGAIVGIAISGGIITIGFWIWAMIDAYQVASGKGKTW